MGRPINKKHIGDGVGKIQVTAVRFAGEAETAASVETHILRQKGTRRFLVANAAKAAGEICTLVKTDPGSLAEGEFCISITDDNGSQTQVTKITNRKIQLEGVYWTKWVSGLTGTLPTVEHAITGITLSDPIRITLGAGHGIANDAKVSIRGIVGTVELNVAAGSGYTVTGTASTTIDLVGVDGTSGHTAWSSGGTVTVAPASIAGEIDVSHLDVQAS